MLSMLVLTSILGAGIFFSLPSNVVDQRNGSLQRTVATAILPESWAFFTKPLDSPEYTAFSPEGAPLTSLPNSRPDNMWGLTRKQRAQGPEMANLFSQVDTDLWVDCEQIAGDCVTAAVDGNAPLSVKNLSTVPTLCGELVLASTSPVPWSYRNLYTGWRNEDMTTYLDVEC
ncbi:SdpA family antimicrobial peptide system protein [Rhodococcus sp. NBC_00294]|uniref:SdpA family antimicrobial peptide system protein n=1 Tax=Rhodococcus sp. NBC_00294 TaxID=2976004 RepID=UPI002E2BC761|nr:SdpA family antimicrobial peptide system protein [Rhodococcus sp. NBC_00294]